MNLFCAWAYPDNTLGPLHSRTANEPTSGTSVQVLLGGLAPPYQDQANSFAETHRGDSAVPGAGLWAGYGAGSTATTYWLYYANPA